MECIVPEANEVASEGRYGTKDPGHGSASSLMFSFETDAPCGLRDADADVVAICAISFCVGLISEQVFVSLQR